MKYFYLSLFLISLYAIKRCMDLHTKQNGVHYLTFCILTSFTLLFDYFLESAQTSQTSLMAQQGIYVALLFMPTIFSNMLHELGQMERKVSQHLLMLGATVFVISVITTEYTGLFYKTYILENGVIFKEYGIMHTLYYIYVALVYSYIVYLSLSNIRRNDVSKYSIVILLAVSLIVVVSVFIDKILKTGFYFDTVGLVICEYLFLILLRRIPLYDLEEIIIEAEKKAERTGIIVFDKKRRLLGYNKVVYNHVNEFKMLKIDYQMPNTFPFRNVLNRFMDIVDKTDSSHFEIIHVRSSYFSFETRKLLVKSKDMGYEIVCHDVTTQQSHIKDIENEITKRIKESDKYYSILNKHIDPKLVSKIISDDVNKNQEKGIVVLFSDISGFTSLSENMKPSDVVEMLNKILSFCENCVVKYGGIIDKYIGDCVMSFWSDGDLEENINNACKAALGIKKACEEFNRENNFDFDIHFSQGIHAGLSVIGFIGDEKHQEYTVIGDTVNTASRLQSLAKKDQILISQKVYDIVSKDFDTSKEGETSLKGKKETVVTYNLISEYQQS